LLPLAARADDTFVIFGLTNQAINGATLSLSENGFLHVDNLSDFGYRGISVNLGEAESGLFFSPQVAGFINDTNFMLGSAFGRISGLDRRICTVAGARNGWATYPVVVDFTPLGSLRRRRT